MGKKTPSYVSRAWGLWYGSDTGFSGMAFADTGLRAVAQSATHYTLPLAEIDVAIATVPQIELFGSLVHTAADAAHAQLGGLGGAASKGCHFVVRAAHVSSGNLVGSASPARTHWFMSSPL